jgi:GTP cyclohydrolase FolE2
MKEKQCSRCKEIKSVSEFSKDKQHHTGYKSACKVCAKGDWIRWRTENLESARKKDRKYHYIRTYNLSEEQAQQLVENRVGICSICGETQPLVVDHCHVTGKVRGLICPSCNSLLGYSKDNVKTLTQAITYLRDFYE